jgi:hypothetical protein
MFDQSLRFLWYIYSMARGMQQQLSPGISWMNGIFYSCLISHCGFSDIIYSIARGVQQQLSPGISWMNGRPTHLLLMFDHPTVWFLWYIGNLMPICDHIPLFFTVVGQFDEVFTAWSMQEMRPQWSLPCTEYKKNDLYLILRISGLIFT